MYKIISKITINNKEVAQEIYATNSEVLAKINNKQILYFKELNSSFVINEVDKKLKPVDYAPVYQQIEKTRDLFKPENISIESESTEFKGYVGKLYKVNMPSDIITVFSEIITIRVEGINNTAYPNFQKSEGKAQLVTIPLEENELVAYNKSIISMPNGIQSQEMELVSIEETDCAEQVNELLSYTLQE
jgi:hypothetical protein